MLRSVRGGGDDGDVTTTDVVTGGDVDDGCLGAGL